ncbi:uncharacterized protein METZ01_LOCUS502334, partial [marine metagenome]
VGQNSRLTRPVSSWFAWPGWLV